jgi:hypothetical protein
MAELTNCLTFILLLLVLYDAINNIQNYFMSERIKATTDGNYYSVVSKYDDKGVAAERMAKIRAFIEKVLKRLQAEYIAQFKSAPDYEKGRQITETLLVNYDPNSLMENDPASPDKTSFTKGKGDIIAFCLREKATGKNEFHDDDIVKFVVLHELSHIVTVSYQHTQDFWVNFRFLLEFCEKHGLYTSKNYADDLTVYCGLDVKYNPRYDNKIKSYFIL